MESCAAANVVKCLNFWSSKTLPKEQAFCFYVKSSKNWEKTLRKEIYGDGLKNIVPKTYHALLNVIKYGDFNKRRLICIVREVDKKICIGGIISTCLSFQNFQPVPILIVKVSDDASGHVIQNVGKVVPKNKMKFFHQYTLHMNPNVYMHYYFCRCCNTTFEPLHK